MAIKKNIEFIIETEGKAGIVINRKDDNSIRIQQRGDVIYINKGQIKELIQVLNKFKPKATRETRR